MKDVVFTSVAFGDAYLLQMDRLRASILSLFPDAQILFYRGTMPPGARPMGKSLYGFKPHAVYEARKIADKVIWLDPAMILVDKDLRDLMRFPVVAVQDDHKLNPFISDQALWHYRLRREEIADWHLVGGSIYYWDFRFTVAENVFNVWRNSEIADLWDGEGQTHTGATRGHRSDESLMALALYMNHANPIPGPEVRYCTGNNPMWIKKHFK